MEGQPFFSKVTNLKALLSAPARLVPFLTLMDSTLLAPSVFAQGYFAGSKGARVAGRAGAFVAKADDLSAAEYNPAGFARMSGYTVQLSNRFSYNQVAFTRAPAEGDIGATPTQQDWENGEVYEFQRVENQLPLQGIDPLLGVAADFGLEDWGFALSAYAPPGVGRISFPMGPDDSDPEMGPLNGGQRYMMVERDAQILVYAASAAWKFKDLLGVGATLQWIHVPHLEYSLVVDGWPFQGGANPVSSTYDILSTVTGSDPFTFNAVLGGWVRPLPFLEVGVSGQIIPSQIETESQISMETLNIEDDVVTSRNGYPANDVNLTLPLPMTARLGVRYLQPNFDIELDLIYQTWSRVDSFNVATNGLEAEIETVGTTDIDDVVIDKQWKNTLTVRLGGDWQVLPELLTARAGVAYESPVADPAYAHVDFSSGHHLTGALGASVHLGPLELAAAYGYRRQLPITVSAEEGRVYQEVPSSNCDPPGMTDPCNDELAQAGQPAPTVNAGRHEAFSHTASLDAILSF